MQQTDAERTAELQPIPQLYIAGVSPQEVPPDTNQPLLWFEQDNITFRDVQLVNIDASNVCCILSVRGSNNTFEGLQSTACNAQSAIVDIKDTGNGIDTSTLINHSSCTNSTTRAFSVYNSNVTVTDSVFDGLSTALLNGGAIAVNNTDGSSMSLHNCSFVNNAATSSDDGYGYLSFSLACCLAFIACIVDLMLPQKPSDVILCVQSMHNVMFAHDSPQMHLSAKKCQLRSTLSALQEWWRRLPCWPTFDPQQHLF